MNKDNITTCTIPATITVARNFGCMVVGTCLGFLHNHLSFLRLNFWPRSKFFSEKNQNIAGSQCCTFHRSGTYLLSLQAKQSWPLHHICTILPIECLETWSSLAMELIDFQDFIDNFLHLSYTLEYSCISNINRHFTFAYCCKITAASRWQMSMRLSGSEQSLNHYAQPLK